MTGRSKAEEVQFYLDRSTDALIMVLRSIVDNPRLANQERIEALRMLVEHHASVANFIATRISDGEDKGRELQRRHAES